jgi:hypothetical protein
MPKIFCLVIKNESAGTYDCSSILLFESLIVYEHDLDSDYERSLDLGTISENGKGSLPMVGPPALRGENISLYKPMPEVLSVSLHAI